MTLNMPSTAINVDFPHDPMSALYTWTDLTKRCWDFTVTRGRTYELTQVQAGTAGVTMENIDGAIDPTNAASPYSPNVKVFRRLKIEATWSGTVYPVYAGLVERWPMEWQDNLSVSPVECTDVFAILANKDLRAALISEMLIDSPASLYPLDDPDGSSSAADITGQQANAAVKVSPFGAGTLTFGAQTTVLGAKAAVAVTSPDVDTPNPGGGLSAKRATWLEVPNAISGNLGWTLEMWFTGPASIPVNSYEELIATANGNTYAQIHLGTFGGAVPGAIASGVLPVNTTTATSVCDGAWHHLAVVQASDGLSSAVYIDGVATTATYGSPLAAMAAAAFVLGTWTDSTDVEGPYGGSIAMFAQYPTALSAARIQAHYNAGTTAFAGETADARIARLLGYAGWSGSTALDTCSTTVAAATSIEGQKALTAIQAVATTEGGAFYIGRDGTPTYQSRRTRMANVTPVAVFGDGPGELPYEGISFDFDPTYVYNEIDVTRSTASTATATDATSAGHYGPRTLSQQMDIYTDSEAADAAAWLLAAYKDPHVRVANLILHPSAVVDPALWTACLSLDIGSRVTVKRRPQGTTNPNPISGDYYVEQIKITKWTADDATFRVALSPIPVQALIADDPVYGLADSQYVAAW